MQTAARAGYDEESTREILQEVRQNAETALEAATARMPKGTPAELVDPIATAVQQCSRLIDLL